MSKHTPGPWYVAPSLNEIVNADHGFLRYDIRADCLLIGALYENEADARLIATAPDLLEALKVISVWAANGTGWKDLEDIRRLADESVNKATGGSDD